MSDKPISFSFSFNTQPAAHPNPTTFKSAIFEQEDPDAKLQEEEELRHQMHVRTGYANVTKSSEQIGRNTSSMAVKQHKKHQVVDSYFTNKIEEMEKEEREKEFQKAFDNDQIVNRVLQAMSQSKEQEQQMLDNYLIKCNEFDNLTMMMGQTKKKIKVCYICSRLFGNAEHLKRHEKDSQLHKENCERFLKEYKKQIDKVINSYAIERCRTLSKTTTQRSYFEIRSIPILKIFINFQAKGILYKQNGGQGLNFVQRQNILNKISQENLVYVQKLRDYSQTKRKQRGKEYKMLNQILRKNRKMNSQRISIERLNPDSNTELSLPYIKQFNHQEEISLDLPQKLSTSFENYNNTNSNSKKHKKMTSIDQMNQSNLDDIYKKLNIKKYDKTPLRSLSVIKQLDINLSAESIFDEDKQNKKKKKNKKKPQERNSEAMQIGFLSQLNSRDNSPGNRLDFITKLEQQHYRIM